MEETSSTAVVEPKKKPQEPGAKAKRLKWLRTNPDFAEAVSEERAAAKMWKDQHDNLHREYMVEMKDQGKWQDKAIGDLQLRNDDIKQLLLVNKALNKLVEAMGRSTNQLYESIEASENTPKAQDEMLELSKKARNPSRVTGGKRGRPQGPKSKAVTF
jgi:hypothetical protein